MKNIIKILSIILFSFFSCKMKAQLDTLNYVKQFEANKAQYINQPFSYLLSQMTQIQPKTVWPNTYIKNKNIVKSSIFNFCHKDYSFKNAISLVITWEEFIPRTQVKYYETKNHFYFTDEEKAFYGSKIVKDIIVYR